MRALKVLVVTMGVLILAAIVAIVIALSNRTSRSGAGKPWAQALALPAGAAIKDFRLDGERLVIRIGQPGRGDRLVILRLDTGAVIGTVTISNAR